MNFHSVGDRFAQFTPNKAEISNYCQIERFGSYKISFVTLRQKKLNVASHLSYDTRMFFSACPFLRIQWFWVLLKCLKYQACFVANFKRAVSSHESTEATQQNLIMSFVKLLTSSFITGPSLLKVLRFQKQNVSIFILTYHEILLVRRWQLLVRK